MKIPIVLFWLIFISGFTHCSGPVKNYTLSGNIGNDLNALLTEGITEVLIMDSVIQSSREMELSYRMQQALERNKEWYQLYLDSFPEARVLPYHLNFGLTATEYNELMQMKLNIALTPSATFKVTIKKSNGMIQFSSDGKIPYLDALLINTNNNTLLLDNYPLYFSDTIFVANENHGLKSMWKGYSWRYSEPNVNEDLSDGLNSRYYNVSIGKLYKNSNTLLVINKRETVDGDLTLKLDKPLVFVNH